MKHVSDDDEDHSIRQIKLWQILSEWKTWIWQLHLAFNAKNREEMQLCSDMY